MKPGSFRLPKTFYSHIWHHLSESLILSIISCGSSLSLPLNFIFIRNPFWILKKITSLTSHCEFKIILATPKKSLQIVSLLNCVYDGNPFDIINRNGGRRSEEHKRWKGIMTMAENQETIIIENTIKLEAWASKAIRKAFENIRLAVEASPLALSFIFCRKI